jgi:phosphoribosyl 1,2-cyclic phosphate phosphodiesterase
MEVRILGSGGSEGIPAFLCQCRVCAEARQRGGREIRQNACAHVTLASGLGILLDMPPQFKMTWDRYRLDQEKLAAILITHRHEDHTLGLKYLIDAIPENGFRQAKTMTVYLPADVLTGRIRQMDSMNDYPPEGRRGPFVEFIPIEAYREITLGSCRVTPLETNHLRQHGDGNQGSSETFGYLFEDADGTRMAYMVDAQTDLPDRTVEALSEARLDCLIFECTFERLDPPIGHTDIQGLIRIGRRFSPRALIAMHISHQNLGHRDLVKVLAGEGIRVAYDGMRMKIRHRHGHAPATGFIKGKGGFRGNPIR